MENVFLRVPAKNEYVVDIHSHERSHLSWEYPFNEILAHHRSILQSKRHMSESVMPERCGNRGQILTGLFDWNLVVA